MHRGFSLALLAVLVVVAVIVSTQSLSPRNKATRARSVNGSVDSLARDSAARAAARQDADTMCFASRLGLPCDPR